MAVRVVPSQNDENSLLMTFSSDPSSMTGYYADGISDDIADDRYETHQFPHYFPDFHFYPEYMPMGTSKPYCLHFDWIEKKRSAMVDRYIHVKNLPYCWGANQPHVRWDANYPKTGLDF